MIGMLKGRVEEIDLDSIILDVSGVGYLIYVSSKTLSKLELNLASTLYIETFVREDLIQLFGFLELEEKKCFNMLNNVSGVGARMALSILSSLSPYEILLAINTRDKTSFKQVSGVGPKLAERLILELKDKAPKILSNIDSTGAIKDVSSTESRSELFHDAISALTNLGISKQDAAARVNKIIRSKDDITLDELIMEAFKR